MLLYFGLVSICSNVYLYDGGSFLRRSSGIINLVYIYLNWYWLHLAVVCANRIQLTDLYWGIMLLLFITIRICILYSLGFHDIYYRTIFLRKNVYYFSWNTCTIPITPAFILRAKTKIADQYIKWTMKRVITRYLRISDSSCRLTPMSWNPREYKIHMRISFCSILQSETSCEVIDGAISSFLFNLLGGS
jgi:hypothetical protein